MRSFPLYVLAFFWVVDAAANFGWIPCQAVSVQIWEAGLWVRVLVGLLLLVLASHVALQWPFGPGGRI